MTKSVRVWVVTALSSVVTARAALYDVPVGNYNVTRATLRMNLPASLHEVRGIYFWGNGGLGDSRGRATDPEMVALADTLGFAVIASSGLALIYPESNTAGDVPSFEDAIAEFARGSGHPELARAPLLPIGHSNGGNTSYDLNAARPERVLATELAKSGNVVPLPPPAALKTPALLVAGELDSPLTVERIRTRFFDNRARGALWAWVEEQGTDHAQVDNPEIAWPFAEMVARLRYPAGASPVNGAVALKDLNEADGWLTDPDSYKTGLADIAPYASYPKDKSRAGWLPNRRAAYLFRAFASYNKASVSATISPANRLVDPGAQITYTISEPIAPWTAIEYYEGDSLIKRVAPGEADALSVQFTTTTTGYVVLHALVTFVDGRQRTTMPRRALVRVPPVAAPESFQPSTLATWGAVNAVTFPPLAMAGVKMMAGGTSHVLALKSDGTVAAWGTNFSGESSVPAGLNQVVSIAAGGSTSGAVKSDGSIVIWGASIYGQRIIPPGLTNVRQIAVGQFNVLALRNDGTVMLWGNASSNSPPPPRDLGLKDIAAVASGTGFSIALKTDGTVVGIEGNSGSSAIPAGLSNVVSISVAGGHALALKADGTVAAWGTNSRGESDLPAGLSDVVAVSAGPFQSLALKADGKVVSWGMTLSGAISPPVSLSSAKAIATTQENGVALVGPQLTLATDPESQLVHVGEYVELSVTAALDGGTLGYQWLKDGAVIPGANASTLVLSSAKATDAGGYRVLVSDGGSIITSRSATVTVASIADASVSRLANVSIRNFAGAGDQTLIVGFAVGGGAGGAKPLLIRGVGPSLTSFGVAGVLVDPKLELFNSSAAKLSENDNWSGTTQLVNIAAQVGAFSFVGAASKDAALYNDAIPAGTYSVKITGVGGATGAALAEIYDATPPLQITAATSRLVNVSARAQAGRGADILIAGFVIAGTAPKTVLIRAIGPTLADFGVTGVLANPNLELFAGAAPIAQNDDWGGSTMFISAFKSAGAFSLTATSKDAALLVTLPPGSYSAQISGAGGTTGVALVEIYEIP